MTIEADYYFCAGDLVNFGRHLDAMGEILKARAERVYVLPGNHAVGRADYRILREVRVARLPWRDARNCRVPCRRTWLFEPDSVRYAGRVLGRGTRREAARLRRIKADDFDLPCAAMGHDARPHHEPETRGQPRRARVPAARTAAVLFLRSYSRSGGSGRETRTHVRHECRQKRISARSRSAGRMGQL